MTKAKRCRPLLLEQLEDRSLLAAGLMWFVVDDNSNHGPRASGDRNLVEASNAGRYQESRDRDIGTDWMILAGRSQENLNHSAQHPRNDMIPASQGPPQSAVIVIPVFQASIKPTADSNVNAPISTPSLTSVANSANSNPLPTSLIPKPQAASGETSNRQELPPLNLNNTFATAINVRSESAATPRRIDGLPQAAPNVEVAHAGLNTANSSTMSSSSSQATQAAHNITAASSTDSRIDSSTILLVTPTGQPLSEQAEDYRWIPNSSNLSDLAAEEGWRLSERTLRDLKALTRPSNSHESTESPQPPGWFAEQTGMIALSIPSDAPSANEPVSEAMDSSSVDVVLGAMIGVNRVITVASSLMDEPLQPQNQAQLLEAIDEALTEKIPLARESTRLNAIAYPAIALVASAIAAAKRYRGNGKMEHTNQAAS